MAYQLQQAASAALGANGYAVCHDGTQLWVACDDFSIKRCTYNESTDAITVVESFTPMSGTNSVHIRHMIYNGQYIVAVGYLTGSYNDPYVKVFEYTGGSLTEKDEHSYGIVAGASYPGAKVCTDGVYYYAIYGSNNQHLYAFSIAFGGTITPISSISYSPRSGNSVDVDNLYIYVACSSDIVRRYTFNGSSFTYVGPLATGGLVREGRDVVTDGSGKVLVYQDTDKALKLYDNTDFIYANTLSVLTGFNAIVDKFIYDGTYIYCRDTSQNLVYAISISGDTISIASSVAQYTTTDPVRLTWWKNKIFAVNGGTDVYAYKNAITGLASVTPTVGAAPLQVTFSVT